MKTPEIVASRFWNTDKPEPRRSDPDHHGAAVTIVRPLSWAEHSYASHAARSAESPEARDAWTVYVCRLAMGKPHVRIPGTVRPISRGAARKLVRRALVLHTRWLVSSLIGAVTP